MLSALKAGEQIKVSTLRMLISAVKNREIQAGKDLDDAGVMAVVESQVKSHKESIVQYEKGNRPELARKEKKELEILLAYMPEQLSDADLDKLIDEAVAESGASGPKEMGKVMGVLMPKVKGRADGTVVRQKVQARLQPK